MVAAGLPPHRRWGIKFHGVRKGLATSMAPINSLATQLVLGHTTAKMATDHYVGDNAMRSALSQIPQPANTPPAKPID